jgi:uncharacterized membrane protein YgcG
MNLQSASRPATTEDDDSLTNLAVGVAIGSFLSSESSASPASDSSSSDFGGGGGDFGGGGASSDF